MKILKLKLIFGLGSVVSTYYEEEGFYISGIPDEFLSNEVIVNANKELAEKYDSLYAKEGDKLKYIGFKSKEESKEFADELREFLKLLKIAVGDKYQVSDDFDFDYIERDPDSILNLDKKMRAEKRRDRRTFLKNLEKAEKGDFEAMKGLTYSYYNGVGTEVDKKKSTYWLKKAAKKDREALYELGVDYFLGRDVRRNKKLALKCFENSAKQGYEDAFIALGDIIYFGREMKRNMKEGMKWYAKGAELGNPYCVQALGRAYEEGALGKPDYAKAFECYFKGAHFGEYSNFYSIGRLYEKGWGVEKNYARALFFYRLSAINDDEEGFYGLGHAYMEGIGVTPNYKKGVEFLEKSAKKGYYRASYFLGMYYKNGKGVEKDDKKAFEYFLLAHDHGSWGGDYELGLCYKEGRGTSKNLFKAFGLIKASAEIDYPPAYFELARLYHEGIGTKIDDEKALEYLLKAVGKKVEGSYDYLAIFYKEKGEPNKAVEILKKKTNDKKTSEYIGEFYHHEDTKKLVDLYLDFLCRPLFNICPFSELYVFFIYIRAMMIGSIFSTASKELVDSVLTYINYEYFNEADADTIAYSKERIEFFKDIIIGKSNPPTSVFHEEDIEGEGFYKKAAIIFGEDFYEMRLEYDKENLDATKEDIINYLNVLSNGLSFIAEDFKDMTPISFTQDSDLED